MLNLLHWGHVYVYCVTDIRFIIVFRIFDNICFQLEETAINELKLHYASTNRSKATFFTVSRLDHVTAKEIEDIRKSANHK